MRARSVLGKAIVDNSVDKLPINGLTQIPTKRPPTVGDFGGQKIPSTNFPKARGLVLNADRR